MRIAINLRQYYKGKIGGQEIYVRNILSRLDKEQLTIFVHAEETEHVREFAPVAEIVGMRHETAVQTIAEALTADRFDLFFCPLLVLEPLQVSIPTAAMMPDLQHEFFPEFFDHSVLQWRRQTYQPTAVNADVLITPSTHAKETLSEKYKVDPNKIDVIYHGVDTEFLTLSSETSTQFKELKIPAKYFYFPANYWPHKNHSNILKALAEVVKSHSDVHLMLTGAPEGSEKVISEATALGIRANIRLLGHVDRAVVIDLYRNAQALLFATKFEGFGIPLLEAFSLGAPAITSDKGSCLEVAGDAALIVDALDPGSIAAAMRRILEDAQLRKQLIERGKARAEVFSWDRAVELHRAAFARVTNPEFVPRPVITVTDWPKIGISTPSYNMAHYIEQTIDSVLSQDYPHIDFVVMDGGSKDNTVEILKKYGDRIRWRSERDGGQADAINKGWHNVSGDLYTFLNADDTYLPGAVSTMAKHFREKPHAGMIYGEAYHTRQDGEIIERYQTQPFDFTKLSQQCYICQPAAFMSRDAFLQAGMINASMNFSLDYELWMRIAKSYPIFKVDEYIATSRMYMDNKTLSSRKRVYQESIGAVITHYDYVPYEWTNAYACYLLDRKDQFFDRSTPTLMSYGLSLALGSYYNRHQLKRYWREWGKLTGFANTFEDRWDDGWISKRYLKDVDIDQKSESFRIEGKHWAPIEGALLLTIKLNGQKVKEASLDTAGPFQLEISVPESARGKRCKLAIEANQTWSPRANGEYRNLSCVIDTINFEPAGSIK